MNDKLYTTDLNALMIFNKSIKCNFLDRLMPIITYIGSAAVTISTCLMLIGLGNDEVRNIGIQALIALISSHLLVRLLKSSVTRIRPKDALYDINTLNVALDKYSFPSGHTAAVFSIATTLSLNFPVSAVICIPIALTVGISRLYLGVHYPSDVLGGIAIAVLSSAALQFIISIL